MPQNSLGVLEKLCRYCRTSYQGVRSRFAALFAKQPTRLAAKDESRRAHAAIVVDLFATIMSRVEGIGLDDMDTTMDMLRCDFPNVEHSWLAERFQEAYTAGYSLSSTLTLAASNRTEAERTALALEILNMLYRVGGDLTNPTLFERITNGLNLPGVSQQLEQLISSPDKQVQPPIECLRFSYSLAKDNVMLSQQDKTADFRVLGCLNVLLLINDSNTVLPIHDRLLHKRDMQILSPGQYIELTGGRLSYHTIRALLQANSSKTALIAYLHCDNDEVSVSRQRRKNCVAKLKFGTHVEIESLSREAIFEIEGHTLEPEGVVSTSYYSPFTVQGLGPYCLAELHNIESPGKSFQLAPESRTVLVTNLPYINKPGALMLAPGLAPGLVFEVSYSRSNHCGDLRLIEGPRSALSINDHSLKDNTVPLKDGDLIGLGPVQQLRCRFSAGVLDEETSLINELKVKGLTRDFVRTGRVVDNIDFSLKRGEMACILGPSGSGKSTLLSMLAGHLAPSIGTIYYDNERMTPDATNLRRHVAFIPREDILDENMSVFEHAYQASISRRPRLTSADRMRRVQAILNFVNMAHLSNRTVGRKGDRTLSDGERTRLNLALDLTGTSEVFLIDEPISGLASSDAETVIETLHNMSAGRIIICTLHRPSQSILNHFSKVMVLNNNGQMAFWGPPAEMGEYFRHAARELMLHVSKEAKAAGGAEYAFEVMAAPFRRLGRGKLPGANMWQERFEKLHYHKARLQHDPSTPDKAARLPKWKHRSLAELHRLFMLWVTRTFLSRVRSRMSMYALLLEAPVLALLIAGSLRAASSETYIFYNSLHITEYLFLSLVLAMFFGLTGAACEIIRDRNIIRRESNYRLFIPGYLFSKILVLTGLVSVQCALYLLVSNAILEIHFMFWEHFAIMVLTAFVGISLSLMVSALVRSERTALNIVPLLLVPQILLAGALIRFEEMNEFCPELPEGTPDIITSTLRPLRHRVAYQDKNTHDILTKPVPLIAEFCPLRYAFEMMFVVQANHNLWEEERESMVARRDYLKDELKLFKKKKAKARKNPATTQKEWDAIATREQELKEKLNFLLYAVNQSNSVASGPNEAKDILRLSRKAALTYNKELLNHIMFQFGSSDDRAGIPAEYYFSNKILVELSKGVNTARKDNRITETRGFFLAPRQPIPFKGMNQQSEEGSISTLLRNAIYLSIMGICPILIAAWRLKRICRGK